MSTLAGAQPKKIRFAVIGLGWVATQRHLPNLHRHREVELVGVIDRKGEHAERVAKQWHIPYWAGCEEGNADWMDQVDATIVATPPDCHYALAKTLLEQHKHVLLEKPMAMRVEEGQELVRLSHQVDRLLAVVHNFQFARSLRALRRKLQHGELGEIQSIVAVQFSNPARRLPKWYHTLPFGLFYDESPHFLYLLRTLAPTEPQLLSAQMTSSSTGNKTPASVIAHFLSGHVPLDLFCHFEAPVSEWHVLVLGSKRLAVADLFRDLLIVIPNDRSHRAGHVLRTSWGALCGHAWGFLQSGILLTRGGLRYGNDVVLETFVNAIQTNRPPTSMSAEDGLHVLELQHRILASAVRR